MHRLRLLLLASLLFITHTAEALTYHRGRSIYVGLLGSNIKFPIFTKEFTEGPDFISVGGIRQLWLDDQQKTLGLHLGIENIPTAPAWAPVSPSGSVSSAMPFSSTMSTVRGSASPAIAIRCTPSSFST